MNDHGIGNDQFAGLLEAATAAAGQEAQDCQKGVDPKKAVIKHLPMRATRLSSVTDKQGEQNGRPLPGNLKRRRTSAVNVQQHSLVPHTYREGSDEASERPSKRKRVREPSESDCLEIAAKDPQDGQGSTSDFRAGPRQQSLSDARTAGVHSAAALFRRVSSTSRKHTRPPMSKLFSSLELPPEVFLHLQAAAKGYMLDPVHPERTDCVGQRGKGDTEMVKLRLWHCVKEFLEGEGFGEKFFGRHVPGDCGTTRALVWPSQANEIISALTPLLRRMVTNERQRQYALVTRKGSNMGSGRKKMVDDPGLSPDRVMNLKSEGIGLPDLRLKLNGRLPDTGEPPQSSGKYKEDARLDNLGILSGLPSEDWNGLVAAVGDHVRMFHYGDRPRSSGCLRNCDEETTSEILQTGCLDHGSWRAGIGGTIAKKRSL